MSCLAKPIPWGALALIALIPACSNHSGGSHTLVLAEADIGPAGGTLEVSSGTQAGLRLIVPPGALNRTERLRVVRPGFSSTTYVLVPGEYLLLEPADAVVLAPIQVVAPFEPDNIQTTGSGNILGRVYTGAGELDVQPGHVDVARRRAEFSIPRLGGFQVVQGPVTEVQDFLPATQDATVFDGGSLVSIAASDREPNLAQASVSRWTLAEGVADQRRIDLYVDRDSGSILGRFDEAADWQEIWGAGFGLLNRGPEVVASAAQIYTPFGSRTPSGTAFIDGVFMFRPAAPVLLGGELELDVARLDMTLQWRRSLVADDLVRLQLWLTPDDGVVAIQWDDQPRQLRLP